MKPIVIQNIYNQYRHSIMQNLTKAIHEICDEEYLWVNYLGKSMNRDELVSALNAGLINYEKWQSEIQGVRFFDDCAVLTSIDSIIVIGDGYKLPMQIYITAMFLKRENGWKLISGQSTNIIKSVL